MSRIHVCPLSHIEATIVQSGARHLVTLINPETIPATPKAILAECHLKIGVHDIEVPGEGMILPAVEHVAEILGFARAWDRVDPVLVHCFAGISRSTAAAYVIACAVSPDASELQIAQRLRSRSATATPNRRLVELADDLMGRRGRMVDAIARIGPGRPSAYGAPFAFDLDF